MKPFATLGVAGSMIAGVVLGGLAPVATARELTSHIRELPRIPAVQPSYPVPDDPDLLFYVQRSANSNTVLYVVRRDAQRHINPDSPVVAIPGR